MVDDENGAPRVDDAALPQVHAIPPNAQMNQLLLSGWLARALTVVARLGVPEALGEETRPVEDIAAAVGADARTLNRVLRALAGIGVFTRQEGGYALTELGATLRPGTPGSLASTAVMLGSDWQIAAAGGLYDAVRTGRPPAPTLWEGGLFGYLDANPADAEVFHTAMVEVSASSTAAVAAGYDFGRFSTLVDVGGGHGYLLAAILSGHPGLRGVLFDQPAVVAGASDNLKRLGVADRCEPVGGDFFASIPPGADCYLLSNILHDWDDEQVLLILRACAAAMEAGSTLLISEWVLSDGVEPAPVADVLDLGMMMLTDAGRERTPSEFSDLLAQAGLHLTGMIRRQPVEPTLLEARLAST